MPTLEPSSALPGATRPSLKIMGWLSVVTGSVLAGAMAALGAYLHRVVTGTDDFSGHPRWTGGPEFTRRVFELFGTVFLFGLAAVIAGGYQVRRNRQHRGLAALMFALLAVMFYLGYRVMTLPPGT